MRVFALICIGALANIAAAHDVVRTNPEGMTQPSTYSHLAMHGNLMLIAGQVAADENGQIVGPGDMAVQYKQVLENLKTVLASQGADFSDILKITIYTTDIDAFRNARSVGAQYFAEHPPASTLVQIEQLARPVFLLEIEAIAIKP